MTLSPSDQSALDAQYNLRAAVPEHPTYFAKFATESAALRERHPGRLNLAYGDSERQVVDLFLPEATTPPLLVFIHGGYWQAFGPRDFSFVAGPFLERGAAVALLGYDLAPEVSVTTIVAQMRAGLAWLYRHGHAQGFDPERIFVAGHSAGGHLAAMTLATDWSTHGLPADLIKGVCAVSGVFDLEPVRLTYLNEVLGMDAEEAGRNSPIRLGLHGRCPVTVAVGERETRAFHEQSAAYAAKLAGQGWPVELMVQPEVDHFQIVMALADANAPTVQTMTRHMEKPPA